MDKRLFNKLIKREMLSYGFEKTGSTQYAKDSQDGITKIVIRTPEYQGFIIGAQFKDYGKFNGKIADTCVSFGEYSLLLCAPASREYSENEIIDSVNTVMNGIDMYLTRGREAIRENIDHWDLGITEIEQNKMNAYFDLPLLVPYSEAYMLKTIDEVLKQGGASMMSIDEYNAHKEYYDKFCEHGCSISIGDKFVTISYNRFPRKYD